MNWNFREGGETVTPQDAAIKEFSKHIFESIVRESIQNSLDNPNPNATESVIVTFEFGEIPISEVPGYEDLMRHYELTHSFWQNQITYKPIFEKINKRISDFSEKIPYLKISDYNTTGMDLQPQQNEDVRLTSYFAFTRGNNSIKSNTNSGGSEGQGKASFYAASSLRTLFIHTVSKYGSIYEGLTKLATHKKGDKYYSSNGHLFQEIDNPDYEIVNANDVLFRRSSSIDNFGTTITILGIWLFEEVEQKMIKSAINNFWMAITEGNLIIKIGATELNKENIETLINEHFPDRKESSRTKSNPTIYGNAKCYFETWTKFQDLNKETYSEILNILGKCTLKIAQHPDYPGKIAFLRKQKMLIRRSAVNEFINKGYCGVFICEDDKGNKILRKMEGKTHTEWDPNFCILDEDVKTGEKAINEIEKFIKNSWDNYRSKHFPETIELKGLAGISFGKNKNTSKRINVLDKNKPIFRPKQLRPKPEFEKLGIMKKGLSSIKEDGIWKYSLLLKTNEEKQISITMKPATDATKMSDNELVEITNISDGWTISNNTIMGNLQKGENSIVFSLNSTERLALDFKIKSI